MRVIANELEDKRAIRMQFGCQERCQDVIATKKLK